MDIVLITLAFISGMIAFFSPCCIAMLPAYISFYLGKTQEKKCPFCNEPIKETDEFCDNCGEEIKKENEGNEKIKKGNKLSYFGYVVAIIGIVILFYGFYISNFGYSIQNDISNKNYTPLMILISGIVVLIFGFIISLRSGGKSILEGIRFGVITTFGFLTVFLTIGVIVGFLAKALAIYLTYLVIGVSIFLIILGILMILNINLSLTIPFTPIMKKGIFGFYVFGIGYGIVALGCTFPILLALVGYGLIAGDVFTAFFMFFFYSLGKGTLMVLVSILISTSKDVAVKKMKRIIPHIKNISAVVLMIMGAYLIYYYWYYFKI